LPPPNFWAGCGTANRRLARQMPWGFVQCFPIIAWQSWFKGKRQFAFYLCITYEGDCIRRGFIIRLKRLKPSAPDFEEPQDFGSKENFHIFVSNCIRNFVLVQRTFFTMPLSIDLYSRGHQRDARGRQVARKGPVGQNNAVRWKMSILHVIVVWM